MSDGEEEIPVASLAPDADAAFLLAYLRENEVACPRCGYNLHRLTSPRCPECGEMLRIGVSMAQPHLRGWVALAVPLIASAGIGVLFGLLVLKRGSMPWRRYPFLGAALVWFGVAVLLAAWVVVRRRWVLRWPRGVQVAVAAAAWGVSVLALFMMFWR